MSKRGSDIPGSFRQDLVRLLEQLNEELLIELGKPLPPDRCLPPLAKRNAQASLGAMLDHHRDGDSRFD